VSTEGGRGCSQWGLWRVINSQQKLLILPLVSLCLPVENSYVVSAVRGQIMQQVGKFRAWFRAAQAEPSSFFHQEGPERNAR